MPLIQLMSISVIIRIMLTVWILYFHAITGLPHMHYAWHRTWYVM